MSQKTGKSVHWWKSLKSILVTVIIFLFVLISLLNLFYPLYSASSIYSITNKWYRAIKVRYNSWNENNFFTSLQKSKPEFQFKTCKNTIQGKHYITDNLGFICLWQELDFSTGCCPHSNNTNIERYSCGTCDLASSCCLEYEFCIACCLKPERSETMYDILLSSQEIIYDHVENSFDFCVAACRTSSLFILN